MYMGRSTDISKDVSKSPLCINKSSVSVKTTDALTREPIRRITIAIYVYK